MGIVNKIGRKEIKKTLKYSVTPIKNVLRKGYRPGEILSLARSLEMEAQSLTKERQKLFMETARDLAHIAERLHGTGYPTKAFENIVDQGRNLLKQATLAAGG